MYRVGGDVTLREDPRIGGRVDRPDLRSAALELLRDARRSRKEVDCGPRSGAGEELAEHRNESPLGAQVLDHRPIIRGGRRLLKHSRQRGPWESVSGENVPAACGGLSHYVGWRPA